MKFLGIFSMGVFLLSSCSGYKLTRKSNPFEFFNISSISIPVFINESRLPGFSAEVSKQLIERLRTYNGVKIYEGLNYNADAFLVGVVQSPLTHKDTFTPDNYRFESTQPGNKASRLYLPTGLNISSQVTIYLIKDPAFNPKHLLVNKFGKIYFQSPKVLFKKVISVSSRITFNYDDASARGKLYYTQRQGLIRQNVEGMAKSAVDTFERLVVNAF